MADSMSISAAGTNKIDLIKLKKLTAQEILEEESKGEELPAELITWAQQMTAFSKIPDDVTYEQVDGDIGIDALDKLGIEEEVSPQDSALPPDETEVPDVVKDIGNPEEADEENPENIFLNNQPGFASEQVPAEEEEKPEDELSLADSALNTDLEEIRKRKERKGIQ